MTAPRTAFEDRYLAEARRIYLQEVPDLRYEIFLFGSRARGSCEHSCDVDIGIVGPDPLPGWRRRSPSTQAGSPSLSAT